ncbi:MAG TPA: zinc ABC transporter substrate-binding protein [Candidatus Angelobacter sp.]|nr:zinc ABC transporter substrate-binding protein [Candidatus Angelobacter sp.]
MHTLKQRLIRLASVLALATLLSTVLAACGSTSPGSSAGNSLQVVAGENFWGSIAAQLGGSKVSVTSIVTNPNTDPHDYESSATDARALATADYVILNGAGYDDWGQKLLSSNPSSSRKVMTIASLLGKKDGDNPHFWYNPAWVTRVADQITADYKALDSADGTYFDQQRSAFRSALQPYQNLISQIRAKDSGQAVGATESIFVYMADALGLNLTSPPAFMQAMAEGDDPPAQTVAEFQNQISTHQIKVLVYNTQASSPITDNLKQLAGRNSIPVVGISETVEPTSASFQDWQVKQLQALAAALNAQ